MWIKYQFYEIFSGQKKILPKKATRNVTLAALLIEEVTKRLTLEWVMELVTILTMFVIMMMSYLATNNQIIIRLIFQTPTNYCLSSCCRFSPGPSEVGTKMEGVPIKETMLSDMCPDIESAFCFPHKYRTINGECNNVKNPTWGITGAAYLRILEPTYQDGKWEQCLGCFYTEMT